MADYVCQSLTQSHYNCCFCSIQCMHVKGYIVRQVKSKSMAGHITVPSLRVEPEYERC